MTCKGEIVWWQWRLKDMRAMIIKTVELSGLCYLLLELRKRKMTDSG